MSTPQRVHERRPAESLVRAVRRILERRRRYVRGLARAHLERRWRPYDASSFWDEDFYVDGVSDAQTIRRDQALYPALYHYAATEALILRALYNEGISLDGARVIDMGAGAGHWTGFYRGIGVGACDAVDVSRKCVVQLRERFAGDAGVSVHEGTLAQFFAGHSDARYELANAIGVMFHVVDDAEWEENLRLLAEHLEPGGLLLVGGWFGWLDVDVQHRPDGTFTKRLRSRRHWRRALRRAGFRQSRVYRNRAYLFIEHWIPEDSILLAWR